MKPKRFFFHQTRIFGQTLSCGVPLAIGFMVLVTGLDADAGDILRGGGAQRGKGSARKAANIDAATPDATDAARANARDMLARTNRTLTAMRAMQNAARNAANKGPNNLGKNPLKPTVNLPKIPNGLVAGGLKVSGSITTDPAKWTGAKLPTQTVKNGRTKVTIKQTEQQALLEWETFNVGKNTTLTFDQKKGGENVGQWIAFNKVSDPTANPTQILGNIKADGQVYIINPNGIIFGGSSQVNARSLTASSLPINDNLVSQGLLNNRDAQFLFSGLTVPGGADGTPDFNPEVPISGKFGDIVVEKGAVLRSPAGSGGNGGRIMLAGPNVTNNGTISTESGQTILAAGLQVSVAAHDGSDPSLRGLDVWIGEAGDYAGTATNTGIIESLTGSISITGKNVNQLGALESSTSVNLNGRIDLKASYGAVSNPNFDSTTEQGAGGPMFFNQFTGVVTLGRKSSTRILPDYASGKLTPGIALPERSQVNIEGLAIHFDKNSTLFAPNGEVTVRAGTWPYKDADGSRNIFGADGNVEAGITNYYTGKTQKFLLDAGQIHIDKAASVSVAGSVDVFVPLAHSLLEVELRGSELADSPLQRNNKNLRGVPLTVDIRTTGSYNGKFWTGTPLGDVAGLAGLIQRNAAQLTASGGNISFQSGGSIVASKGSALDVSGGYYRHEAGDVRTSFLIQGGRLVAIKDATPDQIYDGVFNGESVFNHEKWGISKTFSTPLFSATHSKSYVEGAAGGSLSLTAPTMALDGELRGITVEGPQQRSTPPAASSIKINFEAEKAVAVPGSTAVNYIAHSPTPPAVTFANKPADVATPVFSLVDGLPAALPQERIDSVVLSKELLNEEGFGSLEIRNPDGSIIIPDNVTLTTEPKGSITLAASNLMVLGSVIAPGGKLSFTTYNISPSFAAEYSILNPSGTVPYLAAAANRGMFTLGSDARLSTAGLISDDRPQSNTPIGEAIVTAGGTISIRSYSASLWKDSVIDVSGGVHVSDKAAKTYGKAGTISITTGNDAGFAGVIGGTLDLKSTLRGYSGSTGGSLNIQANLIEVGGTGGPGTLNLTEGFFRTGGFTKYSLTGIGARSSATPPAGQFESYIPAVSIAAGAKVRPLAQSYIAKEDQETGAISLKRFTNEDGLRSAVSMSFTALGSDDPFTIDSIDVRGDISMGKGSSIRTEPGATVSFKGGTVTLLGSVIAPGGAITVAGASSFPLTASQRLSTPQALPTVHLGDHAKLSAAGILQLKPDVFGRRVGTVYDGGVISVSGNILAEKGSALNVEGASGILDLDPLSLEAKAVAGNPTASGLTSKPLEIQGIATRVDSDGGIIDLSGSQMLLSDATLLGKAGGSTARGGQLVVSSGRYYREGEARTGADINLVVTQSGDVILNPDAVMGAGTGLLDKDGAAYGNHGAFSLDRFTKGSFSSLSLGGKYFANASPIPYGGNVEFQGKINLNVGGTLRLAAGGIIKADDTVNISASYLAIGQDFRSPENPEDVFLPFQKDPALPSSEHNFAPSYGSGSLTLGAKLIDVGTLSLQSIGNASLTSSGDIRGNGTFHIAGDATFTADQVYPTSLTSFTVFAYDHSKGTGSVTIRTNGKPGGIPLSAGGNLSVFASSIHQLGVLRAPMGSIRLGWDGTDLDPGDSDIDSPYDIIAGSTIAAPITRELTLGDGSLTSVSAATKKDDPAWLAPFGASPDGQTWIDPRGVNVTLSGLPGKSVSVTAESVDMKPGASVDIRGGGELLASRWVPGIGGSMDLLGSATAAWGGGTEYQAGDLVSFNGETWSARVRNTGQSPTIGLYWSKVAESFAIIPNSSLQYAPINSFNTGTNAGSLAGDPGYVNTNLDVGDTITLDGSKGVPAGTYTLLPRRYALLPGAYLVTPVSGSGTETIRTADGARLVSGYLGNRFNDSDASTAERARFEIAGAKVVENRVSYERYTATEFLGGIADKLELENPQLLPGDAGYALFHGNSALRLAGQLRTKSPGLGAAVDVSSFANINLQGDTGTGEVAGVVTLRSSVLTAWGADSLLIGGIRHNDSNGGASLEVRTNGLTLDNRGGRLSAADIVLASNDSLTVASGSDLAATGESFSAQALTVSGDGTLLRASADTDASTIRTNVGGSTTALMTIGDSAKLGGASVSLDSTFGTNLSANVSSDADRLTLGSGQISVVFDNAPGPLAGSGVDPHLVLRGDTLGKVLQSSDLTLLSYSSIDFYGGGTLGSAAIERLTFAGSGLRGFGQAAGQVVIRAGEVTFDNTIHSTALADPGSLSGRLAVNADIIRLGANSISVAGYQDLTLNARNAIMVRETGSFSTNGNLHAKTPLLTGEAGASYAITAAREMALDRNGGKAPAFNALGAGLTLQAASIAANTDILLPSGQLTLRATTGNLEIGGNLSVQGSSRTFNDVTRYSNAGTITLDSQNGSVVLEEGSSVSVAASTGGNSGSLRVITPKGSFSSKATLLGSAGTGYDSGSFLLDSGSLNTSGAGSLAAINAQLDSGGFITSRSFRIHNGDVVIDHDITSHEFNLAADSGSILVTGKINSSGKTGGTISLAAHGNLILAPGSELTVAAMTFDSAGKGGSILLEAGTQRDGIANPNATLDLQNGSKLDLSVLEYVAGWHDQPGSSAFEGKFTGTLHLRAPRTEANNDLQIAAIQSTIIGASSVLAEGFKVYAPANGTLNIAQRNLINTDAKAFLGEAGAISDNEAAMRGKLLAGSVANLDSLLVIAPGVEIINPTGDLTLGLANNANNGTTNVEALAAADWDLSKFRYGSRNAPGVLTLRANGNLVFNNTLSDGFNPIAQGSAQIFADNGHSLMWLGKLMTVSESLPANLQSWSYRLTAGADTGSSNFRSVLPTNELDLLQPGKGSVIVGEFYPAIPNKLETGLAAAIGIEGQTADSIRISTTATNRGNRFEVIRTGTGGITISAGRDVQLRNQFSSIYTAGVALPTPTTVSSENDFVVPVIPTTVNRHPGQSGPGVTLGSVQQLYQPSWSMAGGSISVSAQANIGRYTLVDGVLTVDSSRQMPTNWLYRRGYVDPTTGLFAADGGFGSTPNIQNSENINDAATSTTWWIDYSNFFQGVGTLGGGNIDLYAGNDIINVDAVAPTNARMSGRRKNPDFGTVAGAPEYINLAPDENNLLEFGGGDVTVKAGRNIDGGVYYVEKGTGVLVAGGDITTNAARSPSLGILDGSEPLDPLTWMPTTLFVGKSHFDVSALGDVLLGPVTNAFLMPQGLNNRYWYKTSFSTLSPDSGVAVSSYGGSVTHRMEITLPDSASSRSILDIWYSGQNLFTGASSALNASNFQPWLRLTELDLGTFSGVFNLAAPNLRSTSFAGDINIAGSVSLAPSATGDLELAASGGIIGLQNTGPGRYNNQVVNVWTSSVVNVSDASPSSIPGVTSPLAYQSLVGRNQLAALQSEADLLRNVNLALDETGSSTGLNGTTLVKQALHGSGILHLADPDPVRLYALGGDISGFTLYAPKETRIIARRDIMDIAFYLQNVHKTDVTLVSAGRDIIPFNENASLRSLAVNPDAGNYVGDAPVTTVTGDSTNAMSGDIQINGPGMLEVLSGRNLDLGTGANLFDGTGVGITSIGNIRNPNLPFAGADIIALAGVTAPSGEGPAQGLSMSSMNIDSFIETYLAKPGQFDSTYWDRVAAKEDFEDLTDEQQAIIALEKFYDVLRDAGKEAAKTGKYTAGYTAVKNLFGKDKPVGGLFTRAREIRTTSGGTISLGVPGGSITMASEIFGNPLTPPGIVTEYGGAISTFTNGNVDIGQARIFTLRGGDITMWSSNGNIAAGTSPRTVVTAPPTRVVIDISSADVQTDLGGLATGGGIGVLAAVEGVKPGNVALIAPKGYVDAGDAGIQATGNITIAANVVLNATNISAGGSTTGAAPAAAAAPSVTTVTSASNATAASTSTAVKPAEQQQTPETAKTEQEIPSLYTVEVIGYGGGSADEEEDERNEKAESGTDANSQTPEP